MLNVENFGKLLPTATAALFALALIYCAGVFRYVGLVWLSALTPTDVVSITLPIIALAIAMFLAFFTGIAASRAGVWEGEIDESKGAVNVKHPHAHNSLTLLLPAPVLLGFIYMIDECKAEDYKYWFWAIPVVFLFMMTAQLIFRKNKSVSRVMVGMFLMILFVVVPFSIGATTSGYLVSRKANDLIKTDRVYKVNVVLVLDKGVIATQRKSGMIWFPKSEIKWLVLNQNCASPLDASPDGSNDHCVQ